MFVFLFFSQAKDLCHHLESDHVQCSHAPDCEFTGKTPEVAQHVLSCDSRMVFCPQGFCDLKIREREVLAHNKAAHHVNVNESAGGSFTWLFSESNLAGGGSKSQYLFSVSIPFDGKTFFALMHRNPKDLLFYQWVYVLGSPSTAEQYYVDVTNGQESNQLMFKAKVFPLDESREAVWAHKDSVGVPANLIRKMLLENTDEKTKKQYPLKLSVSYKLNKR